MADTFEYEFLLFTRQDGVATITINRPERRNAMNQGLMREVIQVLEMCQQDLATRAVVLTGAGGHFSSGGDVKDMAAGIAGKLKTQGNPLDTFNETILKMRELPKPILGSIAGSCVGGGFGLALACDMRIAAQNAKFGAVFVKRALSPDSGASYFLTHMLGPAKTLELCLLGDNFGADEALRLGLVNWVVPDDQLPQATRQWAQRLAQGPTKAIGRIKNLINTAASRPELAPQLELEKTSQMANATSPDFAEGVQAFLQKREPKFKGR